MSYETHCRLHYLVFRGHQSLDAYDSLLLHRVIRAGNETEATLEFPGEGKLSSPFCVVSDWILKKIVCWTLDLMGKYAVRFVLVRWNRSSGGRADSESVIRGRCAEASSLTVE